MPRVGDFHFRWKPAGVVLQYVTDFKDCFGLDQRQARLYTAIARRIVLVMAALATRPARPVTSSTGTHGPAATRDSRAARPGHAGVM